MFLKVLLDKSHSQKPNYAELFKGYKVADIQALKDLILLMQENQELNDLETSMLVQDLVMLVEQAERNNPEEVETQMNIAAFTRQVTKDLPNLAVPFKSKTNLDVKLRKALQSLKK